MDQHFKAGTFFSLDITFESPLPMGAIPVAVFKRDGGVEQLSSGGNAAKLPGPIITVDGIIPPKTTAGRYALISIQVVWSPSYPQNAGYHLVEQPFDGHEYAIVVDPLDAPPQPPIPRVVSVG